MKNKNIVVVGGGHAGETYTRAGIDGHRPSIGNRLGLLIAKRKIGVNETSVDGFAFQFPNARVGGNARLPFWQHGLDASVADDECGTLQHLARLHHHPRAN